VRAKRPAGSAVLVVRRRDQRSIDLDELARESGLHPAVVRRFVQMGLLEPLPGSSRFPGDAATRLARASRLRRDLGLSYAGAVFATELLARIDELEARLRLYQPPNNHAR
jgi:hypothetical protein